MGQVCREKKALEGLNPRELESLESGGVPTWLELAKTQASKHPNQVRGTFKKRNGEMQMAEYFFLVIGWKNLFLVVLHFAR